MEKNKPQSRLEKQMAKVAILFNKMPLLFLAVLYLSLIVIEKELSDYQSTIKEQYVNNNHLPVSKLGEGSICVHRNELLIKTNN